MQEKIDALAKLAYNHAQTMVKHVTELASITRKKPRIISKNISFKARRQRHRNIALKGALIEATQMTVYSKILMITRKPIPKFKRGAFIDDKKTEAISADGKLVQPEGQEYCRYPAALKTHSVQPLPGGQCGDL